MAGTSVPFFLFPVGSTPYTGPGAGFRGFFAFWMGGAGAVPYTPPPPSGPLRYLDVHGAMPPGEFGTVLSAGTPQASIPSTEPISVNAPQYPRLSTNGVSED